MLQPYKIIKKSLDMAFAAIETADVVIMSDLPSKISQVIAIAHKTRQIVWQNIGFALGIKGLFILGVASPTKTN